MLRPMRHNVLVDLGPLVQPWSSDYIVCPDAFKALNLVGTLLAFGPRCQKINQSHVGQKVLIQQVVNEDQRLRPRLAQRLGLNPHWHVLAPEHKVHAAW